MKLTDTKGIINQISKSGLFWVMLLSFTFRNVYHNFYSGIFYNFDTASYTLAAQNILNGLIDVFRTPGYPIVMGIVKLIDEFRYFENLQIIQHLISFISIIPFYLVCKKWLNNKYLVSLAALSYGCMPAIMGYNYSIFPESLHISSIVFFVFFFSQYLSKPTVGNVIGINLMLFIMLMIKPVSIIFYGVTGFILICMLLMNQQFGQLKKFGISFVISSLLVLGYCSLNYSQNDYFGISSVTHDNNFLNVLHSGAYRSLSDETFVYALDTAQYKGKYYSIYCLNNDHDFIQRQFESFPKFYPVTSHLKAVKRVPANSLGYNRDNVAPLISQAMKTSEYINYMVDKVFYFADRTFYRIKGYWYYVTILLTCLIIVFNSFKRKEIPWFRGFIWISVTGIIFITVIGGVDDGTWERVLLPVVPFFILLVWGGVDDIISYISFNSVGNNVIKE